MQKGKTALERAVSKGQHKIVRYLANLMDITQFDEVCNIDPVLMYMCTVM